MLGRGQRVVQQAGTRVRAPASVTTWLPVASHARDPRLVPRVLRCLDVTTTQPALSRTTLPDGHLEVECETVRGVLVVGAVTARPGFAQCVEVLDEDGKQLRMTPRQFAARAYPDDKKWRADKWQDTVRVLLPPDKSHPEGRRLPLGEWLKQPQQGAPAGRPAAGADARGASSAATRARIAPLSAPAELPSLEVAAPDAAAPTPKGPAPFYVPAPSPPADAATVDPAELQKRLAQIAALDNLRTPTARASASAPAGTRSLHSATPAALTLDAPLPPDPTPSQQPPALHTSPTSPAAIAEGPVAAAAELPASDAPDAPPAPAPEGPAPTTPDAATSGAACEEPLADFPAGPVVAATAGEEAGAAPTATASEEAGAAPTATVAEEAGAAATATVGQDAGTAATAGTATTATPTPLPGLPAVTAANLHSIPLHFSPVYGQVQPLDVRPPPTPYSTPYLTTTSPAPQMAGGGRPWAPLGAPPGWQPPPLAAPARQSPPASAPTHQPIPIATTAAARIGLLHTQQLVDGEQQCVAFLGADGTRQLCSLEDFAGTPDWQGAVFCMEDWALGAPLAEKHASLFASPTPPAATAAPPPSQHPLPATAAPTTPQRPQTPASNATPAPSPFRPTVRPSATQRGPNANPPARGPPLTASTEPPPIRSMPPPPQAPPSGSQFAESLPHRAHPLNRSRKPFAPGPGPSSHPLQAVGQGARPGRQQHYSTQPARQHQQPAPPSAAVTGQQASDAGKDTAAPPEVKAFHLALQYNPFKVNAVTHGWSVVYYLQFEGMKDFDTNQVLTLPDDVPGATPIKICSPLTLGPCEPDAGLDAARNWHVALYCNVASAVEEPAYWEEQFLNVDSAEAVGQLRAAFGAGDPWAVVAALKELWELQPYHAVWEVMKRCVTAPSGLHPSLSVLTCLRLLMATSYFPDRDAKREVLRVAYQLEAATAAVAAEGRPAPSALVDDLYVRLRAAYAEGQVATTRTVSTLEGKLYGSLQLAERLGYGRGLEGWEVFGRATHEKWGMVLELGPAEYTHWTGGEEGPTMNSLLVQILDHYSRFAPDPTRLDAAL